LVLLQKETMPADSQEVTTLLAAIRTGNGAAKDRLVDLVYRELHGMAIAFMRQVLVEHARRWTADKRGGGHQQLGLDAVLAHFEEQNLDVLAVHEALEELAKLHERQSQVVTLRFLFGFTVAEVAEQLGVSAATVEGDWRLARAWLRQRLRGSEP
jgi:RNA polymerase sigma factor (TIGR02999 family)